MKPFLAAALPAAALTLPSVTLILLAEGQVPVDPVQISSLPGVVYCQLRTFAMINYEALTDVIRENFISETLAAPLMVSVSLKGVHRPVGLDTTILVPWQEVHLPPDLMDGHPLKCQDDRA